MRTVSLGDKLLQNAIMRNLVCNEAKTRLDCMVVPSFSAIKEAILLYSTIAVGPYPPEVESTNNHAQLLGLCICTTFVCPAQGDDDIE